MTQQQLVLLQRNNVIFKLDMLVNELNRQKAELMAHDGSGPVQSYARLNQEMVLGRVSELLEANVNHSMQIAALK